MAKVVITLDTETHAVGVAIDGNAVPTEGLSLSKYKSVDGEERVNFSYSQTVKDANGMEMVNYWYLPEKQDMMDEEDMHDAGKCKTKKASDSSPDDEGKCKKKAAAGLIMVTGTPEEITARMCASHLMKGR